MCSHPCERPTMLTRNKVELILMYLTQSLLLYDLYTYLVTFYKSYAENRAIKYIITKL